MRLALCFHILLTVTMTHAAELQWSKLPSLPDKEGFAAMYSGVSHGALLAAGGANFPGQRPWEGGTKVWYDTIWVLEKPEGSWVKAGTLPKPLGYGVSVTWNDEVICAGGSNADGHQAEVFALKWNGTRIRRRSLPSLPQACANMSGVLLGDTLHIAGGISTPTSTEALATFWSLDLGKADAVWQQLETWPGPGRMLATMGAHGDRVYLFSGAALHADADGKPERDWLRDAYSFTPGHGWEKLPDLPRAAIAAPSPAIVVDDTLLIASGDDGGKVGFKPETQHPGFPRDVLVFEPVSKTWKTGGVSPFSLATAPTTMWQGLGVVVGGEARPGYRTPEVWSVRAR